MVYIKQERLVNETRAAAVKQNLSKQIIIIMEVGAASYIYIYLLFFAYFRDCLLSQGVNYVIVMCNSLAL